MRKLLDKTDKDLARWLRKTIASGKYEAEFLYKPVNGNSILTTLYRTKLNKNSPKVIADNGDTVELETGNIAISAAVVDKSQREEAFTSATEELDNNTMAYKVYYHWIPAVKSYVMVSDHKSWRDYSIFGLCSLGIFNDPKNLIELLEA